MKIIKTETFLKIAANWDFQGNYFKPENQKGQGKSIFTDNAPSSVEDVKKKWKKKKKKKCKKKEEFPKPSI